MLEAETTKNAGRGSAFLDRFWSLRKGGIPRISPNHFCHLWTRLTQGMERSAALTYSWGTTASPGILLDIFLRYRMEGQADTQGATSMTEQRLC